MFHVDYVWSQCVSCRFCRFSVFYVDLCKVSVFHVDLRENMRFYVNMLEASHT